MQEKMRIHVEFYIQPVQDMIASKSQGRAIFQDEEYVRIRYVGDNKREHCAPAHSASQRDKETNEWLTYAQRFPDIYEKFRRKESVLASGTPLAEAPFLTASQRLELQSLNIFTVEALADPPSSAIAALGMGGRALVNKASAFIESAKGSAPVTALAQENAELRAQMEAMRAQIAHISAGQTGVVEAPDANDEDDEKSGIFDKWDDESLKAFIKEKSGALPRGNPSHGTLVRMASEATSREAA